MTEGFLNARGQTQQTNTFSMRLKKMFSLCALGAITFSIHAQTDPEITTWLLNTTGITGRHYVDGNSTPITDTAQANVQRIRYSNDNVYINSSGIPAYIIGPYPDGNPALAVNNNWLFQIPRDPQENTGTLTSTPLGAIGIFINGVPMYDYKDGASYSSSTQQDDMQSGDGVWNRNAILAENEGFDCAKGHPSPIMGGSPGGNVDGSYHHHQNPTAFNVDMIELSDICDMYLADGLYTLDSTAHSPLIGYAFDGYPVYGGYGYANTDGTGGIKRIESSYQKRNITARTHYADGTNVTDGPAVSNDFPLGWYREDYEFISGSGDLDVHNGRFCVTPEYPNGTYAYFATVDENWNSAYPYIIGPEYYGIVETSNFTAMGSTSVTIDETVTDYGGTTSVNELEDEFDIAVYPNPASDLVAIQAKGLLQQTLEVNLFDMKGSLVKTTQLNQGSTIWHLDTRLLYSGQYVIVITDGTNRYTEKLIIQK